MNTYSNASVLSAEGISKTLGGRQIIRDVNVRLGENELVCLLGQSGAGKTTLFHVIAGLYRPDEGRVLLNGQEITGTPGRISYMMQKDLLLPYRTVLDNAALPLILKGVNKKDARAEAAGHFDQFGLSGCEKKYPAELSGGMCQRAALLRTYLASNGMALLDEPFSALDALTKAAIHRWYLDIMQKIPLSTLFITHDIDEAILLSDRIYILGGKPGEIKAELTVGVPKPRRADFNLTQDFLEIKRSVTEKL